MTAAGAPALTAQDRAKEGGGRPIETAVRRSLEHAFGESFVDVRIHGESAAGLRAGSAATTAGEHIFFAHGRYAPVSLAGRMLLAHELTHVVQQRRGIEHGSVSVAAAELEADVTAGRAVTGRSVNVSSARPIGEAGNDDDQASWFERARRVVRDEIRARTGTALGQVEGVATEVATAADTVLWAGGRGLQAVDLAVERASDAAHLSPSARTIAHSAVNAALETVVPGAATVRQAQALANRTGSLDPVTHTPSLAVAVSHAGDAADRARIALVGQGRPEYGIFTAREMGQLEGALAPQIALLFVDAEEVQLVLRGIAALGAVQAIDRAIAAHPGTWPREREFWVAVAQGALFLIGLHASSVGARLRELLVDVGMVTLSSSDAVLTLATDYRDYHGADRDQRIAAEIQAIVRVLAQGVITAINHGRQARARAAQRPDTGAPAQPRPAVSADAAEPSPSLGTAPAHADADAALAAPPTPAPDVGLADRGVRPAPGDRSETRQEWRERSGRERWQRAVDAAFAGDLAEGTQVPRATGGETNRRIDDTRVPGAPPRRLDIEDVPRRPGETAREAVARVRTVIGHTIAEFPLLEQLWNDARAGVLSRNALNSSNYPELYEATRRGFNRRVRSNPTALQIFADAGFESTGGRSSAPRLRAVASDIPDAGVRISLDHVLEKAQGTNWQRALDADNLRFEFGAPNTEREISQMRHPELRP